MSSRRISRILRRIRDVTPDDQALQYREPGLDQNKQCELIIGLDFGTSSTKVVIQAPDLQGSPSFPVDFGPLAHKSSRYLLPTKLWVRDGKFSIAPQPNGRVISNLKTALLVDPSVTAAAHDIDRRRNSEAIAAIYLALVLRYCRKWFLETKAGLVRHFGRLVWSVNLGVPSPCIEDNEQNRSFRRVGKTAWLLSTLPEDTISFSRAREELDRVDDPDYWDPSDESICDFDIIPEIAAGAVGYALSDRRRDGLHVMVDIGASTVDICTFLLTTDKEVLTDRYSLLIADVQEYGIARVHDERIRAIEQVWQRHAQRLRENFEALEPLPDDLDQYLRPEESLEKAVRDAYDYVIEQFDLMMRSAIWKTKLRRHPRAPEWSKGKLPILVIGGGNHVAPFRWAVERLDDWLRTHTRNDGVIVLPVPVPESFVKSGSTVSEVEQRRLAVAWGLSHRALDVGEIIPADRIPDVPPPRIREWRDRFVGKEVV